jgi:hypothetical protein
MESFNNISDPAQAPEGMTLIDNEVLADLYIKASGKTQHSSDCATSIAPAETPRPCDCDQPQDDHGDHLRDELDDYKGRLWCALGQPLNVEYIQAVKNVVAENAKLREQLKV